jgi:hypothetical protein
MQAQPALEFVEDAPAGVRRPGPAERREAWCPMLDGTIQAVTIGSWRQAGRRWQCLLIWGVRGTLCAAWYLYDDRLVPLSGSAPEKAPG